MSSVSFSTLLEQTDADRMVSTVQPISRQEIQDAQQKDSVTGKLLDYKRKNERPSASVLRKESPELRNLVGEWNKLEIKADGILHRRSQSRGPV